MSSLDLHLNDLHELPSNCSSPMVVYRGLVIPKVHQFLCPFTVGRSVYGIVSKSQIFQFDRRHVIPTASPLTGL